MKAKEQKGDSNSLKEGQNTDQFCQLYSSPDQEPQIIQNATDPAIAPVWSTINILGDP